MQHYEITIIGGGIAGLGVAEACAARGVKALLLEAHKTASATSDNTLRIIHGGFRYLQQANLARVIRSLNDQSSVARDFPHATTPLPCLMPLAKTGLKSRLPVTIAAHLYGSLMRVCRSPLPVPSVLSHREFAELAPDLAATNPHGALCWYDLVMTNPALLASQLTETLTSRGITIREETPVKAISETGSGFEVITQTGEHFQSRSVVNTLGPWIHSIEIPAHLQGQRPQWCLGFNLVISKQLHATHALGVQSPDGRLFFCVPREYATGSGTASGSAIGTWYVPCEPPSSEAQGKTPLVPESEIARFIESFRSAYPGVNLSQSDIVSVDAGILPMKSLSAAGPVLYGAELLHRGRNARYVEVLSTKYTTFRSQGARVVHGIGL
jgi:glycerol-3-phosphate dehydrogenase